MKRSTSYLLLTGLIALSLSACNNDKKDEGKDTGKITDIPVTSSSPKAIAAFRQGLLFSDEGNTLKAKAAFTDAIAADSNLGIAYLFRGNTDVSTQEFMDDFNKAKNHLDSASDWEKWYFAYDSTFLTNDWNKRLDIYKKIVDKYPDAARAQLDLGSVYDAGSQFDKGREAYKKAIDIDPKWVPAYTSLVYSYSSISPIDLNKALDYAQKAVAVDSTSGFVEIALGDAYRANNDFEKARAAYAKAVTLQPDVSTAYYKEGHVNSFLGNYDEARKNYTDGMKYDNNDANAKLNSINTYLYAGDEKGAMKACMDDAAAADASGASKSKIAGDKSAYYATCFQICLHYNDAAHLKELVALLQGPTDQGAVETGTAEAKLNANATMLVYQGFADLMGSNIADAKAKADEAEKTLATVNDPNKLQFAENLRGTISMKEKKYADAITHFEKGNPTDTYNKYQLAQANEAAGNKDKAMELYKQIAAYNFNDLGNALVRAEVKKKVGAGKKE